MSIIVLVDPDYTVRQVLASMLGNDGHEVVQAKHGAHALQLLAESSCHLLITEFTLPGMNGEQLVSELRSAGHMMPVVMVAATAGAVTDYSVFAAVIAKPFVFGQLQAAVNNALRA